MRDYKTVLSVTLSPVIRDLKKTEVHASCKRRTADTSNLLVSDPKFLSGSCVAIPRAFISNGLLLFDFQIWSFPFHFKTSPPTQIMNKILVISTNFEICVDSYFVFARLEINLPM